MKTELLQVSFHSQEPIFSVDFSPRQEFSNEEAPWYKIATAGADRQVRIWKLTVYNTEMPLVITKQLKCKGKTKSLSARAHVNFLRTLSRHDKTVNCVRFSPATFGPEYLASGGDDGLVVIWRRLNKDELSELQPVTFLGDDSDEGDPKEQWAVKWILQKHPKDVSDICWSTDGKLLVSCSSDASAIVWDAITGKAIHSLTHHEHYVQGVAIDPYQSLLATQSSDRTVRLYQASNTRKSTSTKKLKEKEEEEKLKESTPPGSQSDQNLDKSKKKRKFIPQFSRSKEMKWRDAEPEEWKSGNIPEIAPGNGTQEKPFSIDEETAAPKSTGKEQGSLTSNASKKNATNSNEAPKHRMFLDDSAGTFFRRLSFSPDGSILICPTGTFQRRAVDEAQFVTYIFTRGNWGENIAPAAIIPHNAPPHASAQPSLAVRTSSTLFKPNNGAARSWLDVPYKMVFAIATLNSVQIHDTCEKSPVAMVASMHFGALTDVAWSPDSRVLLVSSTDGYLSCALFSADEFGTKLTKDETKEIMQSVRKIANPNLEQEYQEEIEGTIQIDVPPNTTVTEEPQSSKRCREANVKEIEEDLQNQREEEESEEESDHNEMVDFLDDEANDADLIVTEPSSSPVLISQVPIVPSIPLSQDCTKKRRICPVPIEMENKKRISPIPVEAEVGSKQDIAPQSQILSNA